MPTVASLGVPYRWITSYVAGDKIYCIHEADDEEAIREHARRGGFPADVVLPWPTSSAAHRRRGSGPGGQLPPQRDAAGMPVGVPRHPLNTFACGRGVE